MNYPIFSAIVNQVESRLIRRSIPIDQFRVWNEDKINATGLEIGINLRDRSDHVDRLVINLDWDKFREVSLAKKLPGMSGHPLLKHDAIVSKSQPPYLDVEIIWYFDESVLYRKLNSSMGNRRIEAASHWMEYINTELKQILTEQNLITRWHMEIEGDINGRYVTDMSLISYLQYQLDKFDSFNDIHAYLEKNIQMILQRTDTIIKIASKTLEKAA